MALFNKIIMISVSVLKLMTNPSDFTDLEMSPAGRTRTKDKYRVVYSDHQRLELEKEFHYSRYITIRRKAELAQVLSLSERQVGVSQSVSQSVNHLPISGQNLVPKPPSKREETSEEEGRADH